MTSAPSPPQTRPLSPRPRRPRFTLRILLATLTLLSLLLALWTHRAREQRRAVERIQILGDFAHYDFAGRELPNGEYLNESPLPPWLIALLGNDFFHAVTEVNIRDRTSLRELRSVPHLQTLVIKSNEVTDDDLAVLHALPRLRMLVIHGEHHGQNRDTNLTQISDRTLKMIAQLRELEWASIHGRNFTNREFDGLKSVRHLDHLEIGSFASDVTAMDFESLRNHGNIKHLNAFRLTNDVYPDYDEFAGW